jgi:hypothetical protein
MLLSHDIDHIYINTKFLKNWKGFPRNRKVTNNVPCARIVEHFIGTKKMKEHVIFHYNEKEKFILGLLASHLSYTFEYWRSFKE